MNIGTWIALRMVTNGDQAMNRKRQYILRNEIQQFWTGHGWSDEYPDALICIGQDELKQEFFRASCRAIRIFVERAAN